MLLVRLSARSIVSRMVPWLISVAAEEFFGGDSFAADPLLFSAEDVVADPVGVVGGEEFAFFVVEADDFGAGAACFLVGDCGEAVDVQAMVLVPILLTALKPMPLAADTADHDRDTTGTECDYAASNLENG